jgi:integrase
VPDYARETLGAEFTFSLGTSDPKAAKALAERVTVAATRLFEMARNPAAITPEAIERAKRGEDPAREVSEPTPAEILGLAQRYAAEKLEEICRSEAAWIERRAHLSAAERELLPELLEDRYFPHVRDALYPNPNAPGNEAFDEDLTLGEEPADRLLARGGFKLGKDTAGYADLCRLCMKAPIAASIAFLGLIDGHPVEPNDDPAIDMLARGLGALPARPAIASSAPPIADDAAVAGPTLGELIDAEAKRAEQLAPKTRLRYQTTFRLLEEVFGRDRKAASLTEDDADHFFDLIVKLPANRKQKFGAKPLADAIAEAEAQALPKIKSETLEQYVGQTVALFERAQGQRFESGRYSGRNPFAHLAQRLPKKSDKTRRKPWSVAQLNALLTSPHYLREGQRDGLFWLPLLCLFHGLRMNEAAQLETGDFDTRGGIYFFRVTSEGADEKRLKTRASERELPVHPELLRCGFRDFVENACSRGATRLFPEFGVGATGYISDNVSKRFRYLLHEKIGLKGGALQFHGLRHTFRDALREAETSRDLVHELGGWSASSTADRYGAGASLATKFAALSKVRFEGLDLSHLYTAQDDATPATA